MTKPYLTEADRAYIRANYFELEDLCRGREETPDEVRRLIDDGVLPQPSYTIDDVGMFPADYFQLPDESGGVDGLRELFEQRYRAAAAQYPELATHESVESAWRAYLRGTWGECLRQVTPETVVRKRALVSSLCKLICLPRPRQSEWRERLRQEVNELDQIEREFAPNYDRAEAWNDRPPTRDLLIEAARARFPEAFADRHQDREKADDPRPLQKAGAAKR